nr:MAG TPA: hypothetical protein [Caudoviricetes sp.]
MKKVVVRMACGLLLEDEQGQVLDEPGLDTARIVKITVVLPGPLAGRSEVVAAMQQLHDQLCAEIYRQALELCGRDAAKKGYPSLRSPLGQAAVRIIQLLEKGEEK